MTSIQPFLDRLGLQLPIIQAPMAGVSTPRMAAAVSNAGGLGSLAIGAGTVAQARQMIMDTRALTDGPININVFCHAPAMRDARREAAWLAHLAPLFAELGAAVPTELDEIYQTFVGNEAAFALLLEQRPAVVSFHFGLPTPQQIAALRQADIYTMATATNLREAALIEQAGVDAIVAQGVEAGGHRGVFDPQAPDERHSTAVLLRLLAGRAAQARQVPQQQGVGAVMAVVDAAARPGADGGAGAGQFRLHVICIGIGQPAQRLQVQAHGLRQARHVRLRGAALRVEQAFARVFGR